jgi:hypothetical protein
MHHPGAVEERCPFRARNEFSDRLRVAQISLDERGAAQLAEGG